MEDLAPTIVKTGDVWVKKEQKGLLGKMETVTVDKGKQKEEKERAFDLMAALTKGGEMELHADIDIVMTHLHCFDKTLMDTVIQDNTNPIAKLELSSVTTSALLHKKLLYDMLKHSHARRLETYMLKLQLGLETEK
eukprot:TRINITY_DN11538_c0_g1_i1.p1 TRINITY_DN11538_c0_g1~~TRINITY_DN11538_c0_g1_i1.p1  ORF type:complete len:156 (+),score=69.00 TRINITY_DN11538_c0_g1_i1:62-469(+)